jgi:hypothetical protein
MTYDPTRVYINDNLDEYEGTINGGHPANHPRRCVGRCRRTNKRCRNLALKGVTRCRYHQGTLQQKQIKKPRLNTLAKRYKVLAGALADYVSECIEQPPHEQLALWEEIALTQHVAEQTIALYQKAVKNTSLAVDKKQELVLATGALMKDALRDVADLCKRAAEIQQVTKDNISVHYIGFIVSQITRIIAAKLDDNNTHLTNAEICESITTAIREQVKIPGQVNGTAITPDMDVMEMDNTVPKEPTV